MPQVQETVDQAQQVIAQINEGNPKELMNNVNDLTKEGQTAMQESVEELKKAVEVLEKSTSMHSTKRLTILERQ